MIHAELIARLRMGKRDDSPCALSNSVVGDGQPSEENSICYCRRAMTRGSLYSTRRYVVTGRFHVSFGIRNVGVTVTRVRTDMQRELQHRLSRLKRSRRCVSRFLMCQCLVSELFHIIASIHRCNTDSGAPDIAAVIVSLSLSLKISRNKFSMKV